MVTLRIRQLRLRLWYRPRQWRSYVTRGETATILRWGPLEAAWVELDLARQIRRTMPILQLREERRV